MQAAFPLIEYDDRDMAKAASRLKDLREAAGISQRELARQIGENPSNVQFWESTGKIPRSDMLLPIATALGVTIEELLGQSAPKRTRPAGRLGQLFEAAAKLPRRQQQKIVELLEPFVRAQRRSTTKSS